MAQNWFYVVACDTTLLYIYICTYVLFCIFVGYSVCCMHVGLAEVGIYRVAGVMRDLDELSKAFDTGD